MVKKGLAMSGKLGSDTSFSQFKEGSLVSSILVRNLRKDVNGEVSKIHGMTM